MSVSNDSMALSTIDDGGALLSSTFIDLYNNDHSVMPELGKHFKIRHSCEREGIELADATWKKHCLDWRRKIYEKLCRGSNTITSLQMCPEIMNHCSSVMTCFVAFFLQFQESTTRRSKMR
jgi:hypothetical protein